MNIIMFNVKVLKIFYVIINMLSFNRNYRLTNFMKERSYKSIYNINTNLI